MWRELRQKGRPLAAPARLLRRQPPDQGHRVGRRSRGKYWIIGRTVNAIGHIAGEEAEGIAGCVLRYGVDRVLAERSRGSVVLVVPSLGRVVGRIALLAKNGDEVEGDRPLGETVLELGRVEVRTLGLCFVWGKPEFACLRDYLVFDELGLTGGVGEGEGVHAPIVHAGIAGRHWMRGEPGILQRRFRVCLEEGADLLLVARAHCL